MKRIELLAGDCDRPGTLGFTLHKVGKWFIRWAIERSASDLHEVIEKKKKEGWLNPEVKMLYEIFDEIIAREPFTKKGVFPDQTTEEELKKCGNYRFYTGMRDILCTLLDEDSYYLLRFFYFLELLFENEDKFRLEMHKEKAYWDNQNRQRTMKWKLISDALHAQRQPLPVDNARLNSDKDSGNHGTDNTRSSGNTV